MRVDCASGYSIERDLKPGKTTRRCFLNHASRKPQVHSLSNVTAVGARHIVPLTLQRPALAFARASANSSLPLAFQTSTMQMTSPSRCKPVLIEPLEFA